MSQIFLIGPFKFFKDTEHVQCMDFKMGLLVILMQFVLSLDLRW